jgi:hypothetical protein
MDNSDEQGCPNGKKALAEKMAAKEHHKKMVEKNQQKAVWRKSFKRAMAGDPRVPHAEHPRKAMAAPHRRAMADPPRVPHAPKISPSTLARRAHAKRAFLAKIGKA